MKKLFVIFNLLFILCFSYLIINIYKIKNIDTSINGVIITEKEFNEFELLIDYDDKDKIYYNEIPYSNTIRSLIKINEYNLPLFDESVKVGDTFLKGDHVGDYIIPFNLRIVQIMEDCFKVENLEETYVDIFYMPTYKISNFYKVNFSIKYLNRQLEIINTNISFNKSESAYDLLINIKNSGDILNYGRVEIELTYYKELDGLYVDKSYVFNDKNGDFVYKVINLKGTNYYKKIYVEVLGEYINYYYIEGELNGNNIVVKF